MDATDADGLVEAACRRTGLSDLGAGTWREGLEVLLASVAEEARLNELGRGVFHDQVLNFLANRLQVEHWHREHPEIAAEEVPPPLFGLGLPRTGSTALAFMLAQDPARRYLRTWEASQPCPPPEAATQHDDPRIAATQAGLDVQNQMFPDFVGMLPSSATGPQECLVLLAMDFRSMLFGGMFHTPSYTTWLLQQADMTPAYRLHRRVLQLLQWRCPPNRWWLKTPSHMHAIRELDAVYGGARFVMTHRDVTAVIPSLVAVMAALSGPLAEHLDVAALARHVTDVWECALRRLLEFRDAGNEHRFYDIGFSEMQSDPMGAIRRLYRWLGEDLSEHAAQRMAAWWQQNSQERHGARRVRPEDYGIDAGELRARFAFYNERFAVDRPH